MSISAFVKTLSEFSMLLIIINFISLLSFLMIRITNNMKRYGIEISVGSTLSRVRTNTVFEIFLLILIGIVIGAIFNISVNDLILDIFLKSTGMHMFVQVEYSFSVYSILIASAILFGIGFLISLFATRQIKKMSPSCIIRY